MEVWKDIKGYEGLYQISSIGQVKALARKGNGFRKYDNIKIINPNDDGYIVAHLTNNKGEKKKISVHRLVASAFIPNPENKKEINHINCVRDDNRVENLEWCTTKENTEHAFKMGTRSGTYGLKNNLAIPVQCCVTGDIMNHNQAAKISGYSASHFGMMMMGRAKNKTNFIRINDPDFKRKYLESIKE